MDDISIAGKKMQRKRNGVVRAGGEMKNREAKSTSTEMELRKRSSSLVDRNTTPCKKPQSKQKGEKTQRLKKENLKETPPAYRTFP